MGSGAGEAERVRSAVGYGVLVAMIVACGCQTAVGVAPRVGLEDVRGGRKMLKPRASVTVCRSRCFGQAVPRDSDLMTEAIARMLRGDEEATLVVDATIESKSWTTGVFGRECVTVTGDVVRETGTVFLPLVGGTGAHHGH